MLDERYKGNSNAMQGIEIGSGFSGSRMLGSDHNDEFYMEDGHVRTRTNRSTAAGPHHLACNAVLKLSAIAVLLDSASFVSYGGGIALSLALH